mmetsp:Transcript_94881/g.159393  ORF Transcript_94881/g.159393 Transcript_94881/m.159393 type:complete len:97 (+) Transcript_94881:141-431(+)
MHQLPTVPLPCMKATRLTLLRHSQSHWHALHVHHVLHSSKQQTVMGIEEEGSSKEAARSTQTGNAIQVERCSALTSSDMIRWSSVTHWSAVQCGAP